MNEEAPTATKRESLASNPLAALKSGKGVPQLHSEQ
jgi:hypothetical protein